jgi:hypothetical protein
MALLCSRLPVISWIVYLVMSRLLVVTLLGGFFVSFCFFIPLYVSDCDIDDSFAPCRFHSLGIERSIWSSVGLFTPSRARRSACSFPWSPLCPFVHMKDVCADLFLR